MKRFAQLSDRSRFIAAIGFAVLLGATLGAASAQNFPPGKLDTACAAQCAENDNDPEFCTLACWVPDPRFSAPAEPVHWQCYSTCRENGGRQGDCLPACRRR
jgi:hypothetical protein